MMLEIFTKLPFFNKVFARGLQCLVNKDKAKINKCLLLIKKKLVKIL
jgi:hypothetical protein